MSGTERLILDLLQVAEAPLYSTFMWLSGQMGRNISFLEFLHVIDDAVRRDIVRLWEVNIESGDRTALSTVPSGLETRYCNESLEDSGFDPFGFSLTLGPHAEVDAEPDWEVNLDFDGGTFELECNTESAEADALGQLARFYPDVSIAVTERDCDGPHVSSKGTLRSR